MSLSIDVHASLGQVHTTLEVPRRVFFAKAKLRFVG